MGNILAGAFAGSAALTLTFPLDYARTRICTDIGKSQKEREFNGLIDCLVKGVKNGGI